MNAPQRQPPAPLRFVRIRFMGVSRIGSKRLHRPEIARAGVPRPIHDRSAPVRNHPQHRRVGGMNRGNPGPGAGMPRDAAWVRVHRDGKGVERQSQPFVEISMQMSAREQIERHRDSTQDQGECRQKKPAQPRCQAHESSTSCDSGAAPRIYPRPAQGLYQARSAGLQLAAQLLDVNLERVGEPIVSLIPNIFIDPRARQHLCGMPQKKDQQRLLLGCERKRMPVSFRSPGGQVDPHVAVGNCRALGGVPASHERTHAGQELLEGEWFGQVVVGAGVQPADPVGNGVARGQKQHRGVAAELAIPLQQGQSILVRQPPVQQDKVPITGAQKVPGRGAVAGALDGIPLLAQSANQEVGDRRLILDQQDPDSHASPWSGADRARPPWRSTRSLHTPTWEQAESRRPRLGASGPAAKTFIPPCRPRSHQVHRCRRRLERRAAKVVTLRKRGARRQCAGLGRRPPSLAN